MTQAPLDDKLFLWRRIFSLKYYRALTDDAIAEELNLPLFRVVHLRRGLEEHLRSKIKVLSPERLEFVCPECLEARVYEDPDTGERACKGCGYVFESREYVNRLPFDTTYALTSDLACGKSLGGTLNGAALLRVLAKSPASEDLSEKGNMHLGLRARLAKIIVETVELPALRRALEQGYRLSVEYGLEGDKLFNHSLGKCIRRAFWLCSMIAENSFRRHLAETCFWFTLVNFGKTSIAQSFRGQKQLNYLLIAVMRDIEKFLEMEKQKAAALNHALDVFDPAPL